MAITGKHMIYDAEVIVNSVDLSDHVKNVQLGVSMDEAEAQAMGDIQKYKEPLLQVVEDITVNFFQDFDTAKVYQTIMPLWSNRTKFTISVKGDSGADGATNPKFSVTVFVKSKPIINGDHGTLHMSQCVFGIAGVMAIDTTP